jgi:hypothetical protein
MKPGSRDELGTRLHAEQQFKDGAIQILMATEAAPYVSMALKLFPSFQHTFEPAWTPTTLRRYESQPDWRCPPLAARYPRLSTDREVADQHQLESVTPGHQLVEALRRHTLTLAQEAFGKGTCFYSL